MNGNLTYRNEKDRFEDKKYPIKVSTKDGQIYYCKKIILGKFLLSMPNFLRSGLSFSAF